MIVLGFGLGREDGITRESGMDRFCSGIGVGINICVYALFSSYEEVDIIRLVTIHCNEPKARYRFVS